MNFPLTAIFIVITLLKITIELWLLSGGQQIVNTNNNCLTHEKTITAILLLNIKKILCRGVQIVHIDS